MPSPHGSFPSAGGNIASRWWVSRTLRPFSPSSPPPIWCAFALLGESESPLNVESLTRLAAPRFFHVELRDETTLPQNLWARSGEDSLTGLFLRRMKALLDGGWR